MKYFTPELYQAFQVDENEEAENKWEEACEKYKNRIKEIADKLPDSVRRFLDNVCLHDADADIWHDDYDYVQRYQMAINQKDMKGHEFYCILRYKLDDGSPAIITRRYTGTGFTSAEYFNNQSEEDKIKYGPQWLYDEFDMIYDGVFVHNIMFSDGLVMSIRFTDFHFICLPYEPNKVLC